MLPGAEEALRDSRERTRRYADPSTLTAHIGQFWSRVLLFGGIEVLPSLELHISACTIILVFIWMSVGGMCIIEYQDVVNIEHGRESTVHKLLLH